MKKFNIFIDPDKILDKNTQADIHFESEHTFLFCHIESYRII